LLDRSPLFVDGLTAEEITAIERRMRDPQFSQSRFLGCGESLVERIKSDAATLCELDISHGQLADQLEAIVREGRRLREAKVLTPEYRLRQQARCLRLVQGEDVSRLIQEEHEDSAVIVDERFWVAEAAFDGSQACPFEYKRDGETIRSCGWASVDFEIRNTRSGSTICLSELLVHMIRDHQFFEGEGLPYRLDPRGLAETLELAVGSR
jgi:hypothetical protein